jgi:hypothetical protein
MILDINGLADLIRDRGWKQCQVGRAAGFFPLPRLNSILRGWQRPGPASVGRILDGLRRLGASDVELERLVREQPFGGVAEKAEHHAL